MTKHPLSRSYGAILPSSLSNRILSSLVHLHQRTWFGFSTVISPQKISMVFLGANTARYQEIRENSCGIFFATLSSAYLLRYYLSLPANPSNLIFATETLRIRTALLYAFATYAHIITPHFSRFYHLVWTLCYQFCQFMLLALYLFPNIIGAYTLNQ